MTQQLLEAPVMVGEIALAPTTELAGLAELAGTRHRSTRASTSWPAWPRPSATRTRSATTSPRCATRDELAPLPRRR